MNRLILKQIVARNSVLSCLCCAAALTVSVGAIADDKPVTYQDQIKPIFDQHCVECHEGWFPKGGLRMDSLENLREGGKNGPSYFAGKPDKGRLINMIKQVPGRFSQMPPGEKALSEEQFQLIRRWIEQGAR
ncbi:c-type cytochrome domain-containing protein [Motiliproteus sp.]|uniref:c-type cytochrome domain-containing protein n=1 Tax=Motiliproteus sp. TaxID=1898955 RepID=UPI003BAAE3C0